MLELLGWNVWWDRKILPGRIFRDVITEELESAKCVIVLWSQMSVRSDYVCDEADDAKQRQVLVPVLIEQVKPPHGFRQHEAADLIAWNGDPDDSEFGLLKNGILNYVSPSQAVLSSVTSGPEARASRGKVVDDAVSRTSAPEEHPEASRVAAFEYDVYISFAHIDDQPAVEGRSGWVSSLTHALEIRLEQLLGRKPRIWREPKLQANDMFADSLVQTVGRAAVFVSVLSPRYAKSEWCLRELNEFVEISAATGGVRLADKLRVFKVVKTPIPRALQPPPLQQILGYEFYTMEPDSGHQSELGPMSPPDAQRLYWVKLDHLAHDIADLLNELEG